MWGSIDWNFDACDSIKSGVNIRLEMSDDMIHFGEKMRIGDLQVVLMAVGLKRMLREDALYGCAAYGPAN